jgi:hypothetical protein
MTAICNYCKERLSVIIPGTFLCSRCHAVSIRSARMSLRSRTSARRAIALISIWRTTLGSA